jgi:predicted phage terminase large subunit-like protein
MTKQIMPLGDFIPALSPKLSNPRHLSGLLDFFQRVAAGESVRMACSIAPRHGKTETLKYGCTWLQVQNPALRVCYATYSDRLAKKKSREIRELAKRAGVPLDRDAQSRADWRTTEGDGGLWATSVGGSITGEGFDLVIIDDPVKGRAEAESGLIRERAIEWLIADVMTRLEPGGSIIVNGTRWHPEDTVGEVVKMGWESINLPAILTSGEPLWPQRWSLAELLKIREVMGGPEGYEWQSLYLGSPRGRGSRVFNDAHFYDRLPSDVADAINIGLDFAYSTKTSADFSVAVVLAKFGDAYFVLDVVRDRLEPRAFRDRVKLLTQTYKNSGVSAYAASTEMGGIEFIREAGIAIEGHPARVDKFSRAIPTAAAWNTGKIYLPRSAPWLNGFVSEVCGFTGVRDRHDDIVDALAAAYDGVASVVPAATYRPRIHVYGGGGIDNVSCDLAGGYESVRSDGYAPIRNGGRMSEVDNYFAGLGMTRAAA